MFHTRVEYPNEEQKRAQRAAKSNSKKQDQKADTEAWSDTKDSGNGTHRLIQGGIWIEWPTRTGNGRDWTASKGYNEQADRQPDFLMREPISG